MTITPEGQLYLCKTPLENDYKNQLTFVSSTAQFNYFNSKVEFTFSDYTYMKKDNQITVGKNIDEIIDCNYLFYRNKGFTNKWYYCFITNMEYVSEEVTRLTIETDCFQTWYFDINYNKCFVEREHVNNDTMGLNTVPEGLECGEYINSTPTNSALTNISDFYICMAVTELPDESIPPYNNNRTYNGVFGGLYYLVFKTAENIEKAIKMYDFKGKADAINSIFMVPKTMDSITNGTQTEWTIQAVGSCNLIYPNGSFNEDEIKTIIGDFPHWVGKSYTPKNNKLYTYPYSFMNVTNNSGTNVIYRYENFNYDETINEREIPTWKIVGSLCPGMSMKLYPIEYKNLHYDYNDGLILGKLPICSWSSDTYLNWLTQNGLNTAINIGSNVLSTGLAAYSGSVNGVVSGLSSVYNSVHEFTLADMVPKQSRGNTNAGDINFSYQGDGGISVYYKSIKDEYAKIIDDYFSMFGYKINQVKVPNITGRKNWNYVKTIDCNIDGNIPQTDVNIIKNMFNSGVTLWHTPANMYNYSLDNSII